MVLVLGAAAKRYSYYDDLEFIRAEFLFELFGTELRDLHEVLAPPVVRINVRLNLHVIVQVAREYSKQLTCEKLIECSSVQQLGGPLYFLTTCCSRLRTRTCFKYFARRRPRSSTCSGG
jgi:hypothetical protein